MAKVYQWTNTTRLGFVNDELDALWERLTHACPTSLPADGDMDASTVAFAVDEVNHELDIKVKYSDGTTVKTGTVTLS